MTTRADVEALARANRDVRALAIRELRQVWDTVDVSDALAVRALVEEMLPALTVKYGDVAATVAADFYDEVRLKSGARGNFTARLAVPAPTEAVQANARWAIAPVFSSAPDKAKAGGRLDQVLDQTTMQQGRDTIAGSAAIDPSSPRWARVPQGDNPCAFCLTMASRGAVYTSKPRALVVGVGGRGGPRGYIPPGYGSRGTTNRRPTGERYHANCDCVPTPIWDGQPYPEGYDPDALYEKYQEARRAAGSGDLRDILSEMRQQQGIH